MTLPDGGGALRGSTGIFVRYVIVLPEPGVLEMNLTLGSSWPIYHPLSLNRWPLPLTTLIGSVQSAESFLTAAYFGLQPLQSTSLTGLGAMLPGRSFRRRRRGGRRRRRADDAQLADDREAHRGYQQ